MKVIEINVLVCFGIFRYMLVNIRKEGINYVSNLRNLGQVDMHSGTHGRNYHL